AEPKGASPAAWRGTASGTFTLVMSALAVGASAYGTSLTLAAGLLASIDLHQRPVSWHDCRSLPLVLEIKLTGRGRLRDVGEILAQEGRGAAGGEQIGAAARCPDFGYVTIRRHIL